MSDPIARCTSIERSGVSAMRGPSRSATELDARVVNRARVREREHLEAARVGQDGARPAHEATQPAHALSTSTPGRTSR